jgi:hypothetical protein
MLLRTRHSAQARAQVKPKQWGPLSSVQSAVRHNADRLGLPVAGLSYWPMWEASGDRSRPLGGITATPLVLGSTASWANTGARTSSNTNTSGMISSSSNPVGSVSQLTMLVWLRMESVRASTFLAGAVGDGSGVYDWGLYASASNLKYCYVVNSSDLTGLVGGTSGAWVNGTDYCAGLVYNGTTLSLVVDGEKTQSTSQTGLVRDGGLPFRVGVWTRRTLGMLVRGALVTPSALATSTISALHEQPYCLIQPYTPPLYFDLGAGAGPTYKVPVISRHYRNRRAA